MGSNLPSGGYLNELGSKLTGQLLIGRRIGEVIRARRIALGMTQNSLAEISGHHLNYIGYLERGERCPNVATLERIADALGTKISDVLREAGY